MFARDSLIRRLAGLALGLCLVGCSTTELSPPSVGDVYRWWVVRTPDDGYQICNLQHLGGTSFRFTNERGKLAEGRWDVEQWAFVLDRTEDWGVAEKVYVVPQVPTTIGFCEQLRLKRGSTTGVAIGSWTRLPLNEGGYASPAGCQVNFVLGEGAQYHWKLRFLNETGQRGFQKDIEEPTTFTVAWDSPIPVLRATIQGTDPNNHVIRWTQVHNNVAAMPEWKRR